MTEHDKQKLIDEQQQIFIKFDNEKKFSNEDINRINKINSLLFNWELKNWFY